MKNTFSQYKKSITHAQKKEPGKSYVQILFEKINRKIRSKYDSFRSTLLKDSTFVEA